MPMFNPPHPGRLLKHQLVKDEENTHIASVAEVAHRLGCHRNTLNRVINGSAAVSAEMAVALEKIGAGSAEHWMRMQVAYDLFQVRNRSVA